MDRDYSIILCYLFCKCDYLVFLSVAVRLVHESKRTSKGSAFHGLAYMLKFLFYLIGSVRRRIVSCHARSDRTLSYKRRDVDIKIPFRSFLELRKAAWMHGIEEASADLVFVRRIRVDSERRKAAITRYLRRDALFYERLIELLRVLSVIEEIVMGVRVYEPRAYLLSADIYDPVSLGFYILSDPDYSVTLDEHVALKRSSTASVIDGPAFEKCFHSFLHHSTVTDFARLRGLSTSRPFATLV